VTTTSADAPPHLVRRVIVVGNLTIDDVVRADGRTRMGQAGGNAVYAALGARLWNPSVGVVTRRGPDLPPDVLPKLARFGVDLEGVVETDVPTARSWLLYEDDGSRRFLARSRPAHETRWVQPSDIPVAWLADGSPVVLIAPMPLAAVQALVEHVRRASPGATVIVDPHESWPNDHAALAVLAHGIDVFVPSRDELALLMGPQAVEEAAEGLRGLGFPAVVVKLGEEGARIHDAAGSRSVPAAVAEPVEVTGAGDTFCGALAGGLAAGLTLAEAVVRGTHTAAWSIERPGSLALASLTPTVAAQRLAGAADPATRTVAVLGSARLGPGDTRWEEARALGAALGARGWMVMTGGYGGLMAATAQGAAQAGAHVVGLPMTGWVGLTPSEHVAELRWSSGYGERLEHILGADVVVALSGGVGTLAEAAVVWSCLQTEPGAARLVLVGPEWERLLHDFAAELIVGAEDLGLARLAGDTAAAMEAVEQAYADRPEASGPRG